MENIENVIDEVVEINNEEENVSTVKIAPEVVATIAGVSTSEVKGVAGMCTSFAGGIAEKLGAKKNITKGIKVDIKEKSTVIDLYIIVDFGVRIPELAWEVQENVKNNVETMTGLIVEKVNVHIDGVSFKKANEETEKLSDGEEEDNTEAEEVIIEETELFEEPEEGSEGL